MPAIRSATIRQRTQLFHDATHVVKREYASDLSLDEVARKIATSRRQLQRIYNEVGNTTFRDQLTQVRMEEAAQLLTQNNVTVREVANRVGYRQAAQFAKAFRVHHGLSPSEYRRNQH